MASKFISGSTNRFAWKLRKAYPSMTWGECFRTALLLGNWTDRPEVDQSSSVFGTWTLDSQHSVAGHFWALGKCYDELQDKGRSFKFKKIASTLYSLCDEGINVSWAEIVNQKGWAEGVRKEFIECFMSGIDSVDTTDRMMSLMARLPRERTAIIRNPRWTL